MAWTKGLLEGCLVSTLHTCLTEVLGDSWSVDAVYTLHFVTVSDVCLIDQKHQLEVHDRNSIAKNSCMKSMVSVHPDEFYIAHSPKALPFNVLQ